LVRSFELGRVERVVAEAVAAVAAAVVGAANDARVFQAYLTGYVKI